MRLDPDLIRLVLLEGEKEEPVDLSSYSEEQINYHRAQLIKAGFAEGHIELAGLGPIGVPWAEIYDLTWAGHEFLSNARNDTIWKRAKVEIAKQGGSVSLEVLKTVLAQLALNLFNS